MMAMLVRSGLPSGIAARQVILDTAPASVTQAEMLAWLGSNEVSALTADPNWPTPQTGELWRQYRSDMLAPPLHKWNEETWPFDTKRPHWLAAGLPARLVVKSGDEGRRAHISRLSAGQHCGAEIRCTEPKPDPGRLRISRTVLSHQAYGAGKVALASAIA